jgi:mRNA interferase RelE/StbE
MLNIQFSKKAKKFLTKCEEETFNRIKQRLSELANKPNSSDSKKVEGRKEKVFRIRVGEYRILYVIFEESKELFISEIDKRGRIY